MKTGLSKVLASAAILTALVGCQSSPSLPETAQQCPEERFPMCTRDYRPVCGFDKAGTHKTYSNGCTACSNEVVLGFTEGKCEATTGKNESS